MRGGRGVGTIGPGFNTTELPNSLRNHITSTRGGRRAGTREGRGQGGLGRGEVAVKEILRSGRGIVFLRIEL